MSKKGYRDFDLSIERSGTAYIARVLNSPTGQASVEFSLPFSELEIENYVLRLGLRRKDLRHSETSELSAAKSFGGRLWNAVFDQEVRSCLRASLEETRRGQDGLRIRLRLANAPELADLPWEYLYDPSFNRFLALSNETPLIRYLDLPEVIRSLSVKPPIRILVMISNPRDQPLLDVEREYRKLEEALAVPIEHGLVSLTRLESATLSHLQRRLRSDEFHIFHFIGHGGFDSSSEDGILVLESEEGWAREVGSQYFGTLLHDHRSLRLVLLNSCEGGRSGRRDQFAGTAQGLIQQGIPAVVAMQFEISDQAAIAFAQEFYSSLATGYPIDGALAEARKAIFSQINELEWATPVLFMRTLDGDLFEMERTPVTLAGEATTLLITPSSASVPIEMRRKAKSVPKKVSKPPNTWWSWGVALSLLGVLLTFTAQPPQRPAIYAVRIQVLDPQGLPVAGSTVRASAGNEPQRTPDGWWEAEIPAAKVPTGGRITLWAEHPEWQGNRKDLLLGLDPNVRVEIRLKQPESWLRGQVVDDSSRALAGAQVSLQNGPPGETRTDSDGRFAFKLSVPPEMQIRVQAEYKGLTPAAIYCFAGRDTCTVLLEKP